MILSYSNQPGRLLPSDWLWSWPESAWPTSVTSHLRIRSGKSFFRTSQWESSITGSCLICCHGVVRGKFERLKSHHWWITRQLQAFLWLLNELENARGSNNYTTEVWCLWRNAPNWMQPCRQPGLQEITGRQAFIERELWKVSCFIALLYAMWLFFIHKKYMWYLAPISTYCQCNSQNSTADKLSNQNLKYCWIFSWKNWRIYL